MTTDLNGFLEQLISQGTKRELDDDMFAWFKRFKQQTSTMPSSIERAMLGGRTVSNVGFAFASGYQSALESLFGLEEPKMASFCVTESAGNHPRSIQTSLESGATGYELNGSKSFVSGGCEAELLYVACRVGDDEAGRPKLKVVAIPADSEGVSIKALPTLPFIPEVSHGEVTFDRVFVSDDQIMNGDGYADYVKPFRTIEDLHVFSAILAFRFGESIASRWGQAHIEAHLNLIIALRSLSTLSPGSSAMHLGLASCRTALHKLLEKTDGEFESKNPEGFQNWLRDRKLLKVAEKAHETRTHKAWAHFGYESE